MRRIAWSSAVVFLAGAIACGAQRAPFDDGLAIGPGDGACRGRSCLRATCPGDHPTRVTGRVTDPAGARGVYNVAVYVPNGDIAPLPKGATCDACARRRVDAAVSSLTDARGDFALDDVPPGEAIPIVIEIGRFRRVVVHDVAPCETLVLPEDATRLPRNGQEGELPTVAVTTGAADALECLLRGIGIDESEVVAGEDPRGHVHLFRGGGGGGLPPVTPPASQLWNDPAALARHDAVILSCEGTPQLEAKLFEPMTRYLEAGGHVLATHFHASWLERSPAEELRGIASFGAASTEGNEYVVDDSFPKGAAFADWLVTTGASTTRGRVRLDNVTATATSVREPPAQGWVRAESGVPRYFSVVTPPLAPPEEQCGRIVLSDLHAFGLGGGDFPSACPPAGEPLSPQQLALEFLLFDLFSCTEDDRATPSPPR